jgi:hypothetical protein
MNVYDRLSAYGFEVEPAPRLNPGNKLNEPFVLRDISRQIVLRGETRDDLEAKLDRFLARTLARWQRARRASFTFTLKE